MHRLITVSFIWGWSLLFIKVAVEGLTPPTVAWLRITLGALVLCAILRNQGRALETTPSHVRHFVVMALAASMVPFTLLAWSEQHITSTLTAVLSASTPLFTAIFAGLAGQERLRPLQGLGLVVGLSGVALASGLGTADLRGSSLAGAAASVGAGACYGIGMVYSRRHLTGLPPLEAAAGQLLAGAALLAPVAMATSAVAGVSFTPSRAAAVVLLGVAGTGIATVFYYRLIADLGPTRTSLVTYFIPIVAVMVGVVVLGEPFDWRLSLGGGVIVAGIAAVTAGRRTATTTSIEAHASS